MPCGIRFDEGRSGNGRAGLPVGAFPSVPLARVQSEQRREGAVVSMTSGVPLGLGAGLPGVRLRRGGGAAVIRTRRDRFGRYDFHGLFSAGRLPALGLRRSGKGGLWTAGRGA
jgi:hypothetical protein